MRIEEHFRSASDFITKHIFCITVTAHILLDVSFFFAREFPSQIHQIIIFANIAWNFSVRKRHLNAYMMGIFTSFLMNNQNCV